MQLQLVHCANGMHDQRHVLHALAGPGMLGIALQLEGKAVSELQTDPFKH